MDALNSKKSFAYNFTVTEDHLDDRRHVNNVVYVQWMQEAADKHWSYYVAKELEEQVIWMVRRHEIDYLNQAFLHDVLLMRTWTGEHTAVTWDRHYEIIRPSDHKKIISAKSVWVLLDKALVKPRRIDESILQIFA
ncbi:MAG: thioesterase family protein [Sediminibacterium sp.]